MRTKTVKRHFCDFCGKGGFQRPKMESHERGCTSNKGRICGMCAVAGLTQVSLLDLIKCLDGLTAENKEQKMAALRLASNDCPACILTALRHHPRTTFEAGADNQQSQIGIDFKFKEEAKAFWNEHNTTP